MTHYADDVSLVRMDVFKRSGKWNLTKAVPWRSAAGTTWEQPASIVQEFRASARAAFGPAFEGQTIVCLEPYHPHAHPLMWVNYCLCAEDST
jgi:hypothetical protein